MKFRKEYIAKIKSRSWETLVEGELIVKRFASSASGSSGFNSFRNISYTGEVYANCGIFLSKRKEPTIAGTEIDVDGVAYSGRIFDITEKDLVNTGGSVDENGTVTGGEDYQVIRIELFEDCVKLFLLKVI
jgi:hypothetical protein